MSEGQITLNILLMDDDPEVLEQLLQSLPDERKGCVLIWEPCREFDEAVQRINARRYDVVVTDIYRDRKGQAKGAEPGHDKGLNSIEAIRAKRFCPVVAFSDGSKPEGLKEGPFIKFADKSGGNGDILAKLDLILDTGIPQIANKLHDELDGVGCTYMWDFLEGNWEQLKQNELINPVITERLIRRRATTQFGRINPSSTGVNEIQEIEGVDFYICPKISDTEYRLGEIIHSKISGEYRVILTPHCHLTVQLNEQKPRADFILTVKTVLANDIIQKKQWPKKQEDQLDQLRRRIQSPAEVGKPSGRYWFLPRFLQMPDLYCDFMRLESLTYHDLANEYESFAVLDTPFAEAFQSCFTRFYSAVGLPALHAENFGHLMPQT